MIDQIVMHQHNTAISKIPPGPLPPVQWEARTSTSKVMRGHNNNMLWSRQVSFTYKTMFKNRVSRALKVPTLKTVSESGDQLCLRRNLFLKKWTKKSHISKNLSLLICSCSVTRILQHQFFHFLVNVPRSSITRHPGNL